MTRSIRTRFAPGLMALLALSFYSDLVSQARSAEDNPVLAAARSVVRVVMASPVDNNELPGQELATIREKGWCIRPFTNSKGFVVYSFFFLHQNQIYRWNGFGSGYLISTEGHWATNDHVVSLDTTTITDAVPFLLLQLSPKIEVLPGKVLWKDKDKDLAIIKTRPPGLTPLVFADPEYIIPTLAVRSIGFPDASDQLSKTRGFGDEAAFLTAKINSGTLSHSFTRRSGAKAWQHHAAISGGNSGGPLVNECGQVVGTNSFGHIEWQLANGAIDIMELLPELDSRGIPYSIVQGPCEAPVSETVTRTMVWVHRALAAFAVVFAVVVALLFAGLLHLKRLLKKGMPLPRINSVLTQKVLKRFIGSTPTAKRDLDGNDWKRDINGRWYRFDAVYGVVYRDDLPGAKGALRLYSADGRELVLKRGQSVVLGSSAKRAQTIIESDYVSGAHVKLSNLDGDLVVEDLGSSNGTFIGDHRLTEPTVLRPGETVRLTNRPGVAAYHLAGSGGKATTGETWTAVVVPQFLGAQAVAVSASHPLSIGRTGDNTINLGEPSVSTRHCVVSALADGKVEVKDLGSLNGTFVEGVDERIGTAILEKGQAFYVANKVYSFKIT